MWCALCDCAQEALSSRRCGARKNRPLLPTRIPTIPSDSFARTFDEQLAYLLIIFRLLAAIVIVPPFSVDVASELNLVAQVGHELGIVVRGKIACHGVKLAVGGEERQRQTHFGAGYGAARRIFGHFMVNARVDLVLFVTSFVDKLARDGLRRGKCDCAQGHRNPATVIPASNLRMGHLRLTPYTLPSLERSMPAAGLSAAKPYLPLGKSSGRLYYSA